jgi:hypothetical protein
MLLKEKEKDIQMLSDGLNISILKPFFLNIMEVLQDIVKVLGFLMSLPNLLNNNKDKEKEMDKKKKRKKRKTNQNKNQKRKKNQNQKRKKLRKMRKKKNQKKKLKIHLIFYHHLNLISLILKL